MNSQEIKTEIAKLEADAKQMVANSHFLAGARRAWQVILEKVEAKEKLAIADIKEDVAKDLEAEASKLEPPK